MKYFVVAPEVSGGLGPSTQMDTGTHPPIIRSLEYRFDGWLGDEILEAFPCFIVTESLAATFLETGFTGFEVGEVSVTTSDQFEDSLPGVQLPKFVWLEVVGSAGSDDFGIGPDYRLVVSEAAFRCIAKTSPRGLEVEDFSTV